MDEMNWFLGKTDDVHIYSGLVGNTFVHQCQSSYLSSFFERWPIKLLQSIGYASFLPRVSSCYEACNPAPTAKFTV